MADLNFSRVQAYEKEVKILYATIDIVASGAVNASKGLASAVKESTAGQYTITLPSHYYKFLNMAPSTMHPTASLVAAIDILGTPATFQASFRSSPAIVIQCRDYAGAAVNPASGTQIRLQFEVRNTSVGTHQDQAPLTALGGQYVNET